MIKIMVYSLAAMLGLFSSPLLAEGGAYQIELIVFSQAMPNTEVFEQTVQPTQWPSDLTELSAYKKPETTTLDDSYAALSKDSAYQPILHVAWIQPVGEGGLSSPVHIQSADGNLNGYVRMQQDQDLQMVVDLELGSDLGDDSGNEVVYRLNEKRPIKPGETYYLDHPKFGVVAKISPL
ncbi:CsiV family protein [Methylobacter sp. G7]|uniref:CsiV family protein n=1 Tax=Methylobacter sp. G7 TaxID=3230117 RepID=UPI003D801155